MNRWIESYERKDFYQWAIVLKANGDEPIGTISVVDQDEKLNLVQIGYCIGSRWWRQGITCEAFSAIRPFISHLFVSERIGSAKPDEKYFDYVFAELKLADKKRTLIVGDSLASDILGGNRYGVDTCYFNPGGKVLDDCSAQPTYEVATLQEILALV